MTPNLDDLTARERRLCEVIAAYYQASEEGQAPQLRTLMQQHPDLEAELTRYFVEQEKLRRVTEPLRSPDGIDREAAVPGAGSPRGGEDIRTLQNDIAGVLADLVGPGRLIDGVRRFGDYELLEKLAIGGMGVVYKARQISLNRLVALKMIRSGEVASESDIRRFRAEAEMVADLDHPSIVPIYEVGEHGGYHFFSMKLLEGGTVAAHLDQYGSDPRAAVRVIATLARAIHHAHQRGILHRDLKPSNILLDARGEPLIADFGLAKRLNATSDLTSTGAIVGTPPYFAPEVTLGRKGTVTTATDVYSLGAILYALLTGRAPFQADSVWETIEKVKEQRPEPPRQFNPQVDADLQTICLKCLEKDPASRYGSARELAEDLERWIRGEPILARPSTWRHRAWLWCRHPSRQREAGLYAVIIGLMLTAWALAGLIGISSRLLKLPLPGAQIIHICSFLFLACLPMILLGWYSMSCRAWAIRAGLSHSTVFLSTFIAYLLGLCSFGTEGFIAERYPTTRAMNHMLFFTIVAFLFTAYCVANVSLWANRWTRVEPCDPASTPTT
jgi:tRNA A-37 threonylcarbamoyl transferase component Bud32